MKRSNSRSKPTDGAIPKRRAASWKVPPVVTRSEVKPHLAAIVRHAATGNEVLVGISDTKAYSTFSSLEVLKQRLASFNGKPKDVDIETLRREWPSQREHVENTGRPIRILRNGEPTAAFMPTPRAMEKKVAQTREALDEDYVEMLRRLDRRLTALEHGMSALTNRVPAENEMKEWRQAMAVARVVLKEWRERQGLLGNIPDDQNRIE